MQRKLLWIINVNFDSAGKLLIIYSLFAKYLRKNGNTMKQLFIDFKKDYNSVRREVLYKSLIEFSIPMKLVRQMRISE